MSLKRYLPATLTLLAGLSLPLTTQASQTFADIVYGKFVPIGNAVVGLLYAIAFILFLIGMVRFFFTGGEENLAKGKQFAFWGIIGFVVLFGVWGLVNVLLHVLTDISS